MQARRNWKRRLVVKPEATSGTALRTRVSSTLRDTERRSGGIGNMRFPIPHSHAHVMRGVGTTERFTAPCVVTTPHLSVQVQHKRQRICAATGSWKPAFPDPSFLLLPSAETEGRFPAPSTCQSARRSRRKTFPPCCRPPTKQSQWRRPEGADAGCLSCVRPPTLGWRTAVSSEQLPEPQHRRLALSR